MIGPRFHVKRKPLPSIPISAAYVAATGMAEPRKRCSCGGNAEGLGGGGLGICASFSRGPVQWVYSKEVVVGIIADRWLLAVGYLAQYLRHGALMTGGRLCALLDRFGSAMGRWSRGTGTATIPGQRGFSASRHRRFVNHMERATNERTRIDQRVSAVGLDLGETEGTGLGIGVLSDVETLQRCSDAIRDGVAHRRVFEVASIAFVREVPGDHVDLGCAEALE